MIVCVVSTIHRVQHPTSNQGEEQFQEGLLQAHEQSVFRKKMENIRKQRDISLVMNKEEYLKRVIKPNLQLGIIFSKNLMECEMGKIRVVMNKPIYLGQAILGLSKIIIYKLHYDYMKPKYGTNLPLCYMDTNRLVYGIKTDGFYEDITSNVKARFDMSGYSHSHPLSMGVNKKFIGLIKHELGGRIMTEFVALRLKLYVYKTLSGSGDKKGKGATECVIKKTPDFEDNKQCLLAGRKRFRKQLLFWNKLHEVHTIEVNKLALSRDDNKRVVQNDGVSTLAHGHKEASAT